MPLEGIIAAGLEISFGVLASLVVLWLVFGRENWIVRLAGLLGFAAPLAWAGVHDSLIIWGTQVVALFVIRAGTETCERLYSALSGSSANGKSENAQYTLKKMLIGTIPAALLFAELHYTSLESQDVIGNVEIGVVWGIVAACVWLARFGAARWRVHWLPMLIVPVLLGLGLDWLELGATVPSQLEFPLYYFLASTAIHAWLLLLVVYLWKWPRLVGTRVVTTTQRQILPKSLHWLDMIIRRSASATGALIFLTILVPGASLYVYMSTTPRPTLAAAPNPNAYELLLETGRKLNLQDAPFLDPQETSGDTLALIISKNQTLLDAIHLAAKQESMAPLTYHRRDIDTVISDVAVFRQLGRTLMGEANFQEFKGRTEQATEASLDTLRMAALSERGGLIINSLVGIAITGVGIGRLHRQIPLLDAGQCRAIGAIVQKLEHDLEPIEEVIRRDRLWCRIAFGWRGQAAVLADQSFGPMTAAYQATIHADLRRSAFYRLLIVQLAVRAFELEHQQLPDSLDQLVPDYLPMIPTDPYDGRPLRYERKDSRYAVYSIGADGVDNGGKLPVSTDLFMPGTDFFLEMFSNTSPSEGGDEETVDETEIPLG